MIRRHIATIGVFAAGTFALSMAVMQPSLLNADDVVSLNLLMSPTVTVGSVKLSAKFAGPQSNPADAKSIPIEVTAVNEGNETVTIPYKLELMGTPKTRPMSRTPGISLTSWSDDQSITIDPGATRHITLQAVSSTKSESYSIRLSSSAAKPTEPAANGKLSDTMVTAVFIPAAKP